MRDFHLPGRSAVWAENGLCATSHPLAAQVALDLLKQGGNAMDAAIAGAVTLGVCEPAMCGLGGDCFALVKPAGSTVVAGYNGSGAAPARADIEGLHAAGHTQVPDHDPACVTLPGAVRAFEEMSRLWGRSGLADSLAPAIRYFEAGVPVHARAAYDWHRNSGRLNPLARKHFLPWGHAPLTGARFAMPGQAEVLRRIASKGADAFYQGEVAEDMLSALQALGGVHTAADLAATRGRQTDPVTGSYREAQLFEHPPNGQGATAILLLNILSHFDLSAMDPFGADRTHLEAEATKLAYGVRNRLIADPDHAMAGDMFDLEFAAALAARIDMAHARPAGPPPGGQPHRDTVYITVVDRDRMAVSLIYSIFSAFGSGIGTEKFGIVFHNRGTGFTLDRGHPNAYAPGKRPMHTIIPGMLAEGTGPDLPFGVMGGQYQAAGHARLVTNLRDYGMELQHAIDAPRSFPDQGRLQLERGYPDSVAAELAARGHSITIPEPPIGGAQAIRIHASGMLEGASDPRKDGCALGY